MVLFFGLGLSFTFFHKLLDQFNIVPGALVLSDGRIRKMGLASVASEEPLGLCNSGWSSLIMASGTEGVDSLERAGGHSDIRDD